MKCSLCNNQDLSLLHQYVNKYNNKLYNRVYYLCSTCELIFLDKNLRLNLSEEKLRYSQHNNDINDKDYLKFLDKLLVHLIPKLCKTDFGLDYGCGPSVVLAKYLSKMGFKTHHYDPLFFSDTKIFEKKYNFITCTEVAEHFYHPFEEFKKINNLLKNNGYFGVMTKLYKNPQDFHAWYYHNDMTHVSFYTKNTINWIANKLNWKIIFLSAQVIIFQKQG
ncbi:MAG: class I SAM-dependent methyltransferase [Bdellovibrionales bacterium]|nr:class I SAM-dependent methyltransferase [Bdellovibrionales bacterium]